MTETASPLDHELNEAKNNNLSKRYKDPRLLASTSSAKLYKVIDERMQQDRILKLAQMDNTLDLDSDTARVDSSATEPEPDDIIREGRLMGRYEHPNIAKVFDIGYMENPQTKEPIYGYIMEDLSGKIREA